MRDYIVPVLLELDKPKFIVKKGTIYNCIATNNLKFLDICNYLAPTFTLDHFLKAYGAPAAKSYWPYEYFTSLDVLDETEFPPYSAFHSSLKQRNTLEPLIGRDLSMDERGLLGRYITDKTALEPVEQRIIGQNRYQVNINI